jgi:hypothetical protein
MGIFRFGLAAGDPDFAAVQVKERRFRNRVAVVNAKQIFGHQVCSFAGILAQK